jgi:hypothetical protein
MCILEERIVRQKWNDFRYFLDNVEATFVRSSLMEILIAQTFENWKRVGAKHKFEKNITVCLREKFCYTSSEWGKINGCV